MVNVKDFDESVVPQPTADQDKLILIFNRQRELMEKYHIIEDMNGFPIVYPPGDLHNKYVQHTLKDYAWRITEELTEATQALDDHSNDLTHFDEELADAYHFLVEIMILTGTESRLPPRSTVDRLDWMFEAGILLDDHWHVGEVVYHVIQQLGNAMNCLKNKPWKTTHMLTDELVFHSYVLRAHQRFIDLLRCYGWSPDKLMNMYFRKARVNQFRQESNY